MALVGLALLAVFPVRPCSQRMAPGRGWPHALGSLLFFFSGDGLLGTLLFACDDGGDPGPDAGGDATTCGSSVCAPDELCCSPGCDEDGSAIYVCDDDCAFTPTGPIWECR